MSLEKQRFVLGIGAPRCGTTWAYQNLREASELYLPPVKELRYFHGKRSEGERDTAIRKLGERSDLDGRDQAFVKRWTDLEDGNLELYHEMFPKEGPVGEVSPIYSIMAPKHIQSVKMVMERFDPKVFYFMRNPLERDKSHIIFSLHRQAKRADVRPLEDYMSFVDKKAFRQRSAYLRNVRNWRKAFSTDLHLYYYDDLARSPRRFFKRFCSELELDYDVEKVEKKPANKSGATSRYKIAIPPEVLAHLRERHLKAVPRWKFLPKRISAAWMEALEGADIG